MSAGRALAWGRGLLGQLMLTAPPVADLLPSCQPGPPALRRLFSALLPHPLPLPVLHLPAQPGDLTIVDFTAKRADNGEDLPFAARTSMRLDTDDANSTFLPGEQQPWTVSGQGKGLTSSPSPQLDARFLRLRPSCGNGLAFAWLELPRPAEPCGIEQTRLHPERHRPLHR